MTDFNKMQQLKRRMFAMRNGAVADTMRKAGAPYRIIFGLNLPQITEIARDFGPDRDLALELRENSTTRESMLIAPMLFPRKELTATVAEEWLRGAMTTEVIDVACLKLMRHLDDPGQVIRRLAADENALARYAALRLGANVLPREMELVEEVAARESERREPMTLMAARMILDDISFRREDSAENDN